MIFLVCFDAEISLLLMHTQVNPCRKTHGSVWEFVLFFGLYGPV